MGMDAELLAIGPYVPELKGYLEYAPDCYRDTPPGATIITTVGVCCSDRASEELAAALHIDPWQFQQHCNLSGEDADLSLMEDAFVDGTFSVVTFLALQAHGFKFYFLPNG